MPYRNQKGKKGENEAIEWFQKHIFDNKLILRRNTNQTFIGCDFVAKPFIVEVKRQETLKLSKWWLQISIVEKHLASFNQMYIPVVMFRQNNRYWEFLISATVIGDTHGYIQLKEERFRSWARRFV